MECYVCNVKIDSTNSNVTLCTTCEQYNRSNLFSKILSTLLDIHSTNQEFETIKNKCEQIDLIIRKYSLFITPFSAFDPDEHDTNRIALEYLRNYVKSEDNNTLQKHQPVKMNSLNSVDLYSIVAMLCRLDIEHGAKELRIRNVVDIVLNVESYRSADPELHSSLAWDNTWRYLVLEQLREKPLTNGPNAIFTVVLHSISNIINMRIRSVYPDIPGSGGDLRKRLDRIFSPLDIHSRIDVVPIITILWSNTKHVSHSTSGIWVPDCIVPLLPKPDCYINNTMISPRATAAALQNPAERSFYRLSCFCTMTQTGLNDIVSKSDQEKYSAAKIKGEDAKLLKFRCPKCSKMCDNYWFDWNAVALFRQNFTGARLTYILVDITSSMQHIFVPPIQNNRKSSLPRILQTKVAIKQLLKEIAARADPHVRTLDKAILTTFDETLRDPALIPLCKAADIAEDSNLARIDEIELCSRSVQTYLYAVLKQVYEMLEQQPFLYIDVYLFSDGVDTSSKKNEKTCQAIIRGLNERIGAKCHFMNCASESEGLSFASWLGDPEADCPLSGGVDEITAQVKTAHEKDHAVNPNLPPRAHRGDPQDGATSVFKPRPKETASSESILHNSDQTQTTFHDYLHNLPSLTRPLDVAMTLNSQSNPSGEFNMLTRNSNVRKCK